MNPYMQEAIQLALEKMLAREGGPFGAVVVEGGKVIGRGWNRVTSTLDPSAHAEIVAIRDACRHRGSFRLSGCEIYISCEPCPMCLGAIYWARLDRAYFAGTKEDAARAGFDDAWIHDEVRRAADARSLRMVQMMREDALAVFQRWSELEDRVGY